MQEETESDNEEDRGWKQRKRRVTRVERVTNYCNQKYSELDCDERRLFPVRFDLGPPNDVKEHR